MISKTFFLGVVFLSFCLVASPLKAQGVKDSFYFMKDDGEFSDEEKDEEAQYIYGVCEANVFQRTYFDCACIAGAFRQDRDKEILIPQSNLLNSLYTDNQRGCTNTPAIAGEAYEFCQNYADTYRNRETNNKEFCECVANDVATKFAKDPYLKVDYIGNLKSDALFRCGKKLPKRRR